MHTVQYVRSSKLAEAGHTWRADGSLIKIVKVNQTDRQTQRWLDVVRNDLEELRPDWNEKFGSS